MEALISEGYRALNAELHAARPDYGARGSWAAPKIENIAAEYGCVSILDYGCGKGALKEAFPYFPVDEYDPAIPGKDGEPKPRDLVVCADVMEHIEPSKVWAVLDHVRRLAQKAAYFSICTVPASKSLGDGRNAHLSVHPAEWWVERLGQCFDLKGIKLTGSHIDLIGVPKLAPVDVKTISALDEEQRTKNALINMARVKPRLIEAEAHDRKAVLVCYGPSLKESWPLIKVAHAEGADIISVSGAHAFLIERGVTPDAHIDCDPRPHKTRQMGAPHAEVNYWLASCVDPSFIDRLAGHDIALWHLWNGDPSLPLLDRIEPGEWMVLGGGSVGLRAVMLLYALGYRTIDIHAMDCSFSGADEPYAGPHFGKPHHRMRVKSGDRWFETGAALVAYAEQFFEMLPCLKGASIRLHGDGLLQHMCRIGKENS